MKITGKTVDDKNQLKNQTLKKNDEAELEFPEIKQLFTKPPGPMTESELIEKMEKFQIGTDASMAIHIKNIITREYVYVTGQSRQILSTDLGSSLVTSLYEIDPEIVEPTLRGKVEQ